MRKSFVFIEVGLRQVLLLGWCCGCHGATLRNWRSRSSCSDKEHSSYCGSQLTFIVSNTEEEVEVELYLRIFLARVRR